MKLNPWKAKQLLLLGLAVWLGGNMINFAQTTAFTYQGRLNDGANPASGNYDLRFTIYDAATGGNTVAAGLTLAATPVSNGLFTVTLDFGPSVFTGANRWLEIAVGGPGGGTSSSFTTLAPRQMVSPAPQALYAETAHSVLTVPAGNITGALVLAQLPPGLITNGAAEVTLSGGFSGDGGGLTNLNVAAAGGGATNGWLLGGNNVGPGQILGSLNNQPVELWVNGQRALRLEPTPSVQPNVIGGSGVNRVNSGAAAVVIGGGDMHLVSSDLSVIGGGWANLIKTNSANSVIGGGEYNAIAQNAGHAVISGGGNNSVAASAQYATVPGGFSNTAAGIYSLAAGNRAKALHPGSFVWGDATAADVSSTGSNQFIIRASGGVGINKTNPATALDVNGTISAASFSGAGTGLTNVSASSLSGLNATNFWQTSGNAGTAPGAHFLGTTDSAPLEFRVNNARAWRLEAASFDNYVYVISSVNVLGGYSGNNIGAGLVGATIAGGGQHYYTQLGGAQEFPNAVTGNYGTVGGGYGNTAGTSGTVSGGYDNMAVNSGTVAGGHNNAANNAGVVPGGYNNNATGLGSFAAGVGATANTANSFLWSDGNSVSSSMNNAFEVYASGGVNFRTSGKLDVRAPAGNSGTIHVGATAAGGDPKLIQFGDGDFVHVGENGLDDRMELKAGTFFFTHDATETGHVGIGTNSPQAMLHIAGAGSLTEPQLHLTEAPGGDYARLRMSLAGNPYWDVAVGGGAANVMNFYNGANGNVMSLSSAGDLTVKTITILGGADLAEPFEMSKEDVPAGAVVVIDENHPGHLKMSESAYDTRVAGVVSGAQGISPGVRMKQKDLLEHGQNVALTGRVYVQAEAVHGAIKPGDLLTTSTLPGRAMKVTDHARSQGAILGKAMTALPEGQGLVLVLVTLQ